MTVIATSPAQIRQQMRDHYLADERQCLRDLTKRAGFSPEQLGRMENRAIALVEAVRDHGKKSLMESFMAEYGLTTDEGIALMCLAEALLRVPDAATITALIEDKIAPFEWQAHLGHAESALVNASTWGLLLSAKVMQHPPKGVQGSLRNMMRRLGEPVIRKAVAQAMKELGRQFVLGQDIGDAIVEGKAQEEAGYRYSYDMLGEAARTEEDAERYLLSYANAITALTPQCKSGRIEDNPGISVKLSALYSRYEALQKDHVMDILVARTRSLAQLAKSANMGFNIDAEEADRLDLSLDVIAAVLSDPSLAGWDGFGVVVQAYSQRAPFVLDWLNALASRLDRKIMVRLVKGAYWDAEVKRAQTLGLDGFPVFTRKAASDISWIACARQLFTMQDRIYPQFATHNAHSMAAVLEMAPAGALYEFQRLHGMGESLHDRVLASEGQRCRIYAPVGTHEDLLAYLVRRLLENGANSSFVHKIADPDVPSALLAADPFAEMTRLMANAGHRGIAAPAELYGKDRRNAKGWDVTDPMALDQYSQARQDYEDHVWYAEVAPNGVAVHNPANPGEIVGYARVATVADCRTGLDMVSAARPLSKDRRLQVLNKAADLFEQHYAEFFALLAREAGKTINDAVAELREAVDFLRYYAVEAAKIPADQDPCGVFLCISPWNFPLAIFTGQVVAALAAGNRVIAKPAEQTPLVAARAVALLHEAGIPQDMLVLLQGKGSEIGPVLLSDKRIDGVCFTGSTDTAQRINRQMADHLAPAAPLIAETGGLNAMIVDSTALPEQAVRDIVASGFQSAGQRCSALRMLYVQDDIADDLIHMLKGAMDSIQVGSGWILDTDAGPVIDGAAARDIQDHVDQWKKKGKLLKQLSVPDSGHYVGPALIDVAGIADLKREIFGPVVHVARYKAEDYDQVIDDINATGYGLTFCLHSRLDDRIAQTCDRIRVGNCYINRNQIGAIVGSQPFGGEGLSGTGPKAGGPDYLSLFLKTSDAIAPQAKPFTAVVPFVSLQDAINRHKDNPRHRLGEPVILPGPTGEANRLSQWGKGVFLCLAPTAEAAAPFVVAAQNRGNDVIVVSADDTGPLGGRVDIGSLTGLRDVAGILSALGEKENRYIRQALAAREGAILPLITDPDNHARLVTERHVSVDTTATGGNASLLMATE